MGRDVEVMMKSDTVGLSVVVSSISAENVVTILMVGDEDGSCVGDSDGLDEGLCDGLEVGFVGLNVGESVVCVGMEVGDGLGLCVGFGVGIVNGDGA